jgi:hypothetical protein
VGDVVVGSYGLAAKEREAEVDDVGAVCGGLVGDGADEGRGGTAHLFDSFGDAVLADDGDVLVAFFLADGVKRTEGSSVGVGGDEDVAITGVAFEEVRDEFAAALAHAAAIDADEGFDGEIGNGAAYGFEHAGDTALYEEAGLGEVEAYRPVDFAAPVAKCMGGEEFAGLEADAIVVDPEEGRVGVRNVDRDEGDLGGGDLIRDDGCDVLLHLELDDEIDTVFQELLGVAHGGGVVIAVVEDHEVNANGGCSGFEAVGHLDGEGQVGAHLAEAEAELLGAGDVPVEAVGGLDEVASMDEGLEDSVGGGLGDACLSMDGLESHRLVFGLEQFEDVERFGEDWDEIEAAGFTQGHVESVRVGERPLCGIGALFT